MSYSFSQVSQNLKGVFFDTFYDPDNKFESSKFKENSDNLWNYAISVEPFNCKDVKVCLLTI